MISKGQQVVVFFRTGKELIGVVESWSDNVSVIMVDNNAYVIMNTKQDVMLVRIMPQADKMEVKQNQSQQPEVDMEDLEGQFNEIYGMPSEDDLRLKKLADLKIMMIDQEKKNFANKIRSHQIIETSKVKYGNPFYTK